MLKRRDAPYVAGRRARLWYKWKRDPLVADCVMMYAQRGNGRRASFYSDYTFGCWSDAGELLPVGKAYSGFTDEELKWLDTFVRDNTLNRFGPVREKSRSIRSMRRSVTSRGWQCAFRAYRASAATSPPKRPTGLRRCARW
jgi:DNA ligase-1